VSALRDADKVIYLLERDWKHQPGLVVNRYNAKLSRNGELRDIDDILDILAIDLLGVVPEDKSIVLATDRGMPVALNKRYYVSQAYRNIAQRIMGNNVPLMDFRQPGLMDSLVNLFRR
jgi:septum site-determining protein MinD